MNSFKFIIFACLVASAAFLASAAPTETPAGQDSTSPLSTETATTPMSTTTTSSADITTPMLATTMESTSQSAPAPSTDDSAKEHNATSPMTPAQNQVVNASTFTCYGRPIGYFADIEQECKVYHFCLQGDYNGEVVYQRISYLCLNNTVFDQQALDCVDATKVTSPCNESGKYYDTSNAILREAIVEHKMQQGEESDKSKSVTTSS